MKAAVQATVKKSARKTAPPAQPVKPVKAVRPAAKALAIDAVLAAKLATTTGRRLQVRKSGVHGRGVFALQPIKQGETIIEYTGETISWPEALRRHPHDPRQPDHTFYFHIDDAHVIDGKVGGNASRWINHACAPNVEADDQSGQVFLLALRTIKPGEELFFDYGLVIEERYTPALKKRFECRCGSNNCRGTMLAPKRTARASKA